MAGVLDEVQSRTRDELREPVRPVDRDPGVLGAPDDLHGQVEGRVQRLDLVGVALVGLGDLPVERRLAGGAEPGPDEQVEVVGAERSVGRPGDVRADERLVQGGRQRGEDRRVLGHQLEEFRAPRRERDHVDERQRPVRRPVQEVGSQRHRAAVVVGDHVRSGQRPVVEQVRQHAPLNAEGDVAVRHRGRAVPEHVPQVDRVLGGERVGDRRPQGRRPGRAVAEHDGWPVAPPTPADLAVPHRERLGQHPCSIASRHCRRPHRQAATGSGVTGDSSGGSTTRPGSVNAPTTAPTRQSRPTIRLEVCRPLMNASCSAWASAG